ncbi:TIGR03067 domain-containing protein [Pseudomonas sp. SK3(2021)]|uniref:TIGR03067 domain-containing protein n=1 Tax=Pseudomonas sp. SK3(2021) TaxID=2841064 RepID=UPI00192AE390|nr:TIGR03067 domain-containing protein [Pseudomonas sp. SK3(2021)]QQZ39600.1 TIGR03067 domain-containing protein [Pseudomonas sp. SK3(2021)]
MKPDDLLDLQRLQGAWEQVEFEDNGVRNPPDEHGAPGALTLIQGQGFRVVTLEGELLLAGRFTLDTRTTPKSITWIDSMGADIGKHLPASYRLEGDDFVFIAADEGQPRPTEFRTGPGETLRRFVRVSQAGTALGSR